MLRIHAPCIGNAASEILLTQGSSEHADMNSHNSGIFPLPLHPIIHPTPQQTMGSRGYKAWRFRKRYYVEYNDSNSYPHDGFGSWLAHEIPSDRNNYLQWLSVQRSKMEEREAEQDRCLSLKPAAQRIAEEEEGEEP